MKKLKDIGLQMTEQDYRNLEHLSYSVLSGMDREGPKSVGQEVKMSEAMLFGTMVDNMVEGTFDIKDYHLTNGVDIGDGLRLAVEALHDHTQFSSVSNSSDIADWKDKLIEVLEANDIDYYKKKAADWVANKIVKDVGAAAYFKDLYLGLGKTIITPTFLNNVTETYNVLKNHEFTKHLFEDVEGQEAVYQFKYVTTINGYKFKGMLDRLIIDHDKKTITPYDLKTGGKSSAEFENSFFYWRYDLQALAYSVICINMMKVHYPDYILLPFKFIYVGRYENKPLVWVTNPKMHEASWKGFTRNGKKYKGLVELLADYDWYQSNSFKVDYPEKTYLNSGEVSIDTDSIDIKQDWK